MLKLSPFYSFMIRKDKFFGHLCPCEEALQTTTVKEGDMEIPFETRVLALAFHFSRFK